jgi:amino acid transporter
MPAALAASAGSSSLLVLAFTLVFVAATALCTAEVSSRYDMTGGPVVFSRSAFGPLVGFVIGWLLYLSRLSSFGAVAAIMLDYAASFWPALEARSWRVVAITVFVGAITVVNLAGVVRGAHASNLLTALKMAPLLVLAGAGVWFAGSPQVAVLEPPSIAGFGNAVLITLFACMGFEVATVVAGEARDPRRTVPRGMLAGIAAVGVLYALLMLACLKLVPDLAASPRPLADAATAFLGSFGGTLVAATAVLSCAGALCAWMIGAPRVLLALTARGELPRLLAYVDPIRRAPSGAILASAMLVWLLTVSGTFVYLATFSALSRLITYGSICLALVVLRRRDGAAPLSIPFGSVLAVVALLGAAVALGTTTPIVIRDVTIAVAVGLIVRALTKRFAT